MSSAVAEPELEQIIDRPRHAVLFMSRRSELRLVLKPIRERRGIEGEKLEHIPGETVCFRDGKLEVPLEGGEMTLDDGRTVESGPILKWLESHRSHGNREEGFWRVDPVAPAPSEDEIGLLTQLATTLDLEGLERFLVTERDGWARPQLLRVAERAIERVSDALQKAQAAAAEQLAAAREEGRREASKAK